MRHTSGAQRQDHAESASAESRSSHAERSPAERIGTLIGCAQVDEAGRQAWNRLLGTLSNAANTGKQDRVRALLSDARGMLHDCFCTTAASALGMPASEIAVALKAGYTVEEISDMAEGGRELLRGRLSAIAELAGIADQAGRMKLAQVRRVSTVAIGVLNAGQERDDGRARKYCADYIGRHVRSLQEFIGILNMGEVRSQLCKAPDLLAEAWRRLGHLSVHFLGHDGARKHNRDQVRFLAMAGAPLASGMSQEDIAVVLEALRQLADDADNDVPEIPEFLGASARRCADVVQDADVAVCALHSAARSRVFHPDVVPMAKALLSRAASGALDARQIGRVLESWRRSGIPADASDAAALNALMERFASSPAHLDEAMVPSVLHDMAEIRELRQAPALHECVSALAGEGVRVAGRMQPDAIARSLRSLGLLQQADGHAQSTFVHALHARGAALIHDQRERNRFGQRETTLSLAGIGDIERGHAQRRQRFQATPERADFIDGLALRAAELDHDALSGSSAFVAFAHIDHRSPAVGHFLKEMSRKGRDWSVVGTEADCARRQNETYWAIARMGLSDVQAAEFARFLAGECARRLPDMDLSAVARHLWSSMVIATLHPGALPDDVIRPALLRADGLLDACDEGIGHADACSLYHAQTMLRGHAHPACVRACKGDADAWLNGSIEPSMLRRHREVQPDAVMSAAEQHVWQHAAERFGEDAQHDVLHHGFGLDIVIRVAPPGRKPFLVDVEIDGKTHQSTRFTHTDAMRDDMLRRRFGTRVLRLPYHQDFRRLTAVLDRELQKLAL